MLYFAIGKYGMLLPSQIYFQLRPPCCPRYQHGGSHGLPGRDVLAQAHWDRALSLTAQRGPDLHGGSHESRHPLGPAGEAVLVPESLSVITGALILSYIIFYLNFCFLQN